MTRLIDKAPFNAATAEAAPESSGEGRQLPPGLFASALRAPLRHWQLSLMGALLSAAAAVLAGLTLSEKSWKAEGFMVYTRLPDSESLRKSYSPQKLETLISVIKSTSDLETLRQEFELEMTTEVLDKKIKVEQVVRAEAVTIALEWGDRDTGAAIVNRLMELHILRLSKLQKGKTAETMAKLKSALDSALPDLSAARAEFVRYLSEKDILDIRKDRDRLDKDVAEAEKEVVDARDDAAKLARLIQGVTDDLSKLEADLQGKSLQALATVAEEDRDYRKRKKELEDGLREEERRRAEAETEFREAQREAESLTALVNRRAGIPVEAEKARAKADLLRLKVANSAKKLKDMAEDGRQLPREYFLGLAADLRKKRSDRIEDARTATLKIGQLEAKAQEVRKRKEKRLLVLTDGELLEKKVQELDRRRLSYEEQLNDLRFLEGEVKIETPATPKRDPFSSNFKKIAAIAFVLPLFLLFAGMVTFDAATNAGTASTLARGLQLPVLARFPKVGRGVVPAEARALALRLRQSVSATGGVLLFNPLRNGPEVNELLCDVSRFLALQDEKVLILDGRISEGQADGLPPWVSPLALQTTGKSATGLVQYLVFEGQSIWDAVVPTRLPGVEYLPAGGPCSTTDVLASQQMRDLLTALRREYSLIVVAGPTVEHPVDAEILSNYADGVVTVVNSTVGSCPPGAAELLQSLRDGGAPLLGAVVCE